jgi:hypothetical protein
MRTESLATREMSGDHLDSGLRTSEPMTRTEHRLLMQQSSSAHVPIEFGGCEIVDTRAVVQKAADFVGAAAHRAVDGNCWKKWVDDEQEKFVGIGEGLNAAKEETKQMAATAVQALGDGRVWNAVMHTPDYLRAAVSGSVQVVDAMARDPHAVDNFVGSIAVSIAKASDSYTHLLPREQGKVIGQVMFALVNPEGSTEGAAVAMQAADRIATHVDAGVVSGIQKSMQAIEEMQQTAPELAGYAKQMLRDYARHMNLGPQELEYAGVPSSYFDAAPQSAGHSDLFAMAKAEMPENWKCPDEIYRGDNSPYSAINQAGERKSHIRMNGDLHPANPKGEYKGKEVTIEDHLDGRYNRAKKANSPFTSFSADGDVAYFGDTRIRLDLKGLRAAIECGEVQGVKILELPDIIKFIDDSTEFSKVAKAKHRAFAIKHNEVAVRGIIPKRFITVEE